MRIFFHWGSFLDFKKGVLGKVISEDTLQMWGWDSAMIQGNGFKFTSMTYLYIKKNNIYIYIRVCLKIRCAAREVCLRGMFRGPVSWYVSGVCFGVCFAQVFHPLIKTCLSSVSITVLLVSIFMNLSKASSPTSNPLKEKLWLDSHPSADSSELLSSSEPEESFAPKFTASTRFCLWYFSWRELL